MILLRPSLHHRLILIDDGPQKRLQACGLHFITCGVLFLSSCMFMPPAAPTDVRFVSAKPMAYADLPEVVKKDIVSSDSAETEPFIQINFSSNYNLLEFARDAEITGYTAYYCHDWTAYEKSEEHRKKTGEYSALDVPAISGATSMYDGAIPLRKFDLRDEKASGTYQIYLRVRSAPTKTYPGYDLAKNAADICFQIGGWRAWVGEGSHSNLVTIPKESVIDALKRMK